MKKVALLIEDMFDEKELVYPYFKLQEKYEVHLLGTEGKKGYKGKSGFTMESDYSTDEVDPEDYDGLVIPGGFSPDYMRRSEATLNFVKALDEKEVPIAAICHGPWLMVSACKVKGKNMTSFPSIKDDLINAGADYLDQSVVVDGNLITSRTPKDLVDFMEEFFKLLG